MNNQFTQEEIDAYLQSDDESERLLGQAWQHIREIECRDDNPPWQSHHWETEGKPDGGLSYGVGFTIAWQRGSIVENGRNGAFLFEVLEACEDELRHKNSLFPCSENEYSLMYLAKCIDTLKSRLARRERQGVLRTHESDKEEGAIA